MDLKDAAGNVTKASTAKLVLLALADHARDGGNGAYPSLTRVEGKTGLNRRTIINALDALKYNGIISLVGRSEHNTNNYTILMQALPVTVGKGVASTPPLVTPMHQDSATSTPPMVTPVHQDGKATLPVKLRDESSHCTSDSPATLPVQPLHQSSHCTIDGPATLPSSVQPLDLNRPLTTIKPSDEEEEQRTKVLTELEGLPGAVPPDTTRLIDTWLEKHLPGRSLQTIRLAREGRARSRKYVDQGSQPTLPVNPVYQG